MSQHSTRVLLICDNSPEDPLNGPDLRIWCQLDKGAAEVFCFQRKSRGENGKPLESQLPWRSLQVLAGAPRLSMGQWSMRPKRLVQICPKALNSIWAEIMGSDRSQENCIVIAHGHAIGLLMAYYLAGRGIVDLAADSRALYFRRRFGALPWTKPLKKGNALYQSVRYAQVERYLAERFAAVVVAGEADQAFVQGYCKRANVLALGNGTDWIEQEPLRLLQRDRGKIIAFHGAMTWEPNRSTAAHLAERIMPRLRRFVPESELRVAGGPLHDSVLRYAHHPGVNICGFVDDIRGWLSACDVYVMPMYQGSGVKTKLLEVMAAGLPIITNSMGAEALPEEAKRAIVIADGDQRLVNAIASLLEDCQRRHELGIAARAAAEKHFRWNTLSRRFLEAIQSASLDVGSAHLR